MKEKELRAGIRRALLEKIKEQERGIVKEYVLDKTSQFIGGTSGNQVLAKAKEKNRLTGQDTAFKTRASGRIDAYTDDNGELGQKITDIPNAAPLNMLTPDISSIKTQARGGGQSRYTKVSLVSGSAYGDFYVNISNIEHDIPYGSDRTKSGSVAQSSVLNTLTQGLEGMGYEVLSGDTAGQGSQVSDVTVVAASPEGKQVEFHAEVKSMSNNIVKMFDKTINRGGTKASHELDLINAVAKLAYESNRSKIEAAARERGVELPKIDGLVDYVELLSELDLGASFSGEQTRGGQLPSEYFSLPPGTSSPGILSAIKQHFAANRDSYFVVNRGGDASYAWYTGYGPDYAGLSEYGMTIESFLEGFDILLSTYGTPLTTQDGKRVPKIGSMRVALTFKMTKGGKSLPRTVREMKSLSEIFLRNKIKLMLVESHRKAHLSKNKSSHPGLLESLSGLMVEAYAPGTKIGLIPMAAKPYHAGHHSLVQTAAAENDQVLLYISLSDRKRKGELTIRGEDMERIWKEEIEKILPGNVTPVYGGVPVRKVYEILGDAEEKLQMDVEPPVYTVYSDPTDTARNYSAAYRMKYFPTVASEGYVKFAGEETPEAFTRGEGTPDVSGTKMRASLQCGDEAAFAEGLPAGVDKEKIFNMLCPIQRMKSTVQEANFRMAVKRSHRKAIQEQSLYDTFVKPFTDVVAVTKLVAQDVLAASLLNLRLWWDLDPEKQAEAFRRYDATKKEIDSKMKPYMDAIDDRLSNADASIIAAAIAPGFFFGQMGLEGAYNAAGSTKEFLTGAGLDLPFLSAFFDGEDPPDKEVERAPDRGLLGGLTKLFFGESAQHADLPVIVEQEEKPEKKEDKPPLKDAINDWLKDTGVQDKYDEFAKDLYEATEKYIEDVIALVAPTAEITLALRGINTKDDNLDIDKIKKIMEKAKEYNLPGADEFDQKLKAGAKKLADKPEFEEKADDLADESSSEKAADEPKDGASEEEEQAAAEKIAIVEFIDSFIKDSEDGLPKLIKSAKEKLEEEAPEGMSLEALKTSELGKQYISLFDDAYQKLEDMADGVSAQAQ